TSDLPLLLRTLAIAIVVWMFGGAGRGTAKAWRWTFQSRRRALAVMGLISLLALSGFLIWYFCPQINASFAFSSPEVRSKFKYAAIPVVGSLFGRRDSPPLPADEAALTKLAH